MCTLHESSDRRKTGISRPWRNPPRPFLKWAGGKTQLLDDLDPYFPRCFERYFEPFLGGGAVFLHLVNTRPRFKAYLSDINAELIGAYLAVRDNVEALIQLLKGHRQLYRRSPRAYYYSVRDKEPKNSLEAAARMIFLNKTCYNGLYRVNRKGKFNVPFGRYVNPKIVDVANLRNVGRALSWSGAEISCIDYREALKEAGGGDVIYLDPPYYPVSATANFTAYTEGGFTDNDQKSLAQTFRDLDSRGCIVILSNSDTPLVRDLYAGYSVKQVCVTRAINSVGKARKGHTELVICNRKV